MFEQGLYLISWTGVRERYPLRYRRKLINLNNRKFQTVDILYTVQVCFFLIFQSKKVS